MDKLFEEFIGIFSDLAEKKLNQIRGNISYWGFVKPQYVKGVEVKTVLRDVISSPLLEIVEDEDWFQINQHKLAHKITTLIKTNYEEEGQIVDITFLDLVAESINDTLESEIISQYWNSLIEQRHGICDFQYTMGFRKGRICGKICLIVGDNKKCHLHM
jgi:hypothetical protein